MSRFGNHLKAMQGRHDYLVDSLANRNVSDGVRGYWEAERVALAWSLPLLTDARRAITALLDQRTKERQHIENGWRELAYQATEELLALGGEESRSRVINRLPEEEREAFARFVQARRYGAALPAADDTRVAP